MSGRHSQICPSQKAKQDWAMEYIFSIYYYGEIAIYAEMESFDITHYVRIVGEVGKFC